jgi:DNA polymerase III epsilon subunit-like protein
MSFIFVGLDGEMSSSELDRGGRLLQIGLALANGASYSAMINPGEMLWDEKAVAVPGFTREMLPSSVNFEEVDQNGYDFLVSQGANPKRRTKTVPVGWNVGAFDMPFVRETLPLTYSLFSRRTVDLNALCFALDGKDSLNFESWKRLSKEYAIEKIGYEDAHDAGWDAKMGLYCFEYLQNVVKGGK